MCDCFHVVLPTWPGAPGSVSGRQLQHEEGDAETEEDHSVTGGPVDELIRPRPQGSSPVYEYTTEGTGFGAQDDGPARRRSTGRRRSWWKRDSADSQASSSMSQPESVQGATEMMLKTEVESGASGYSVAGGGQQGIFVKQVLKGSSAAKLFGLKEGDQLLSATIFFDDIQYEDALKILQYSEPYRVQFQVKRKLPGSQEEEGTSRHPAQGLKGTEEQDQEVADRSTETSTKTLEGDGDRERLLSPPRAARGRRAQERLSWPKFQAIRSKRQPRPRRSRSSSETSQYGDRSPTSTDTEAQRPAEQPEQKTGLGSRRRKFLNLRFGAGTGPGPSSLAAPRDREVQGVAGPAGLLPESGPRDAGLQDVEPAEGREEEERPRASEPIVPAVTMQGPAEPDLPRLGQEAPGDRTGGATRSHRKAEHTEVQEGVKTQGGTGEPPAPATRDDQQWQGMQSLEIGVARLSLQDTAQADGARGRPPETQVQIRELKTPRFTFSKETVLGTQRDTTKPVVQKGQRKSSGEEPAGQAEGTEDEEGLQAIDTRTRVPGHKGRKKDEDRVQKGEEEIEQEEGEEDRAQEKTRKPKVRLPSFAWSPRREQTAGGGRHAQDADKEGPSREASATASTEEQAQALERDSKEEDGHRGKHLDNKGQGKVTKDSTITTVQKDVAIKESKFKMPKFKMPSFGVLATPKTGEAAVEVPGTKVEAEVSLPTVQGELKTTDLSIQLPTGDLEVKAGQVGVKLPDAQLPEGELEAPAAGGSLKGHQSNVQMPSVKMPKVDLKGPRVDIKGPKVDVKGPKGEVSVPELEVSVPSVEVDIQAPGAKLEGDVAAKDSTFKMPKFKMPSFGVSAAAKDTEASVVVPTPKVEADVALPAVQHELKTTDISIELPSDDLEVNAGQVGIKIPDAQLPEGELEAHAAGVGLKGHLPKVQMPSMKMPKVDLKGPQVDIKGPKVDVKGPKGEVSAPELEVSVPSVEVDIQAPAAKREGEVAAKDSKFKMPKFKMPSFGVSAAGKAMEASVEVPAPKFDADVALPAIQGELKATDISIQLPSSDLEVKAGQVGVKLPVAQLPEGQLATSAEGAGLKGHLPKVQMPSLKMPKVDLKGPHVDIKGPKVDVKGPKGEVSAPELEVSVPCMEVDIQAPGATLEGEVAAKDSKFKMPKFKMPSLGVSSIGKSIEASVEVTAPKVEADVSLPMVQGDIRTTDLSIQLPSSDLEVKAGQEGAKLPDAQLPEGELVASAAGAGLKGHLPKVQMPSLKMPKVDLKGPQVDIKGPKVDVKGPKGEVSTPEVEVSVPSMEVDIQALGGRLQGDMATKDSKFKMPKFKMPSFGMSGAGKTIEASVEVPVPKVEVDVALPTVQGELKTTDLSIQLPTGDLEVKAGQVGVKLPEAQLPEGELAAPGVGASLKGHLPKMQMPSLKMPKVDLKGPQVDIKGPKVDVKGPKDKVSAPELEVSVPSLEVDIQAPGVPMEGEVAAKDSKFKMPKFTMPSFGVLATGKSMEASLEEPATKIKVDVALPVVQGNIKTTDLSIQFPTGDLEVKAGQEGVKLPDAKLPEGELEAPTMGASLKGHLSKVQMPSLKMPKVDLKGPHVDIKGPKVDVKDSKGEVSTPELEVSVPSVEVDIQAPGATLEGEVAAKDSKFKMPKFKMPSFGVSAVGKSMEASVEVPAPKVEADLTLPAVHGDSKTTHLSIQFPSGDLEVKAGQEGVKLPDAKLPEGELAAPGVGAGMKGHLPKVQMPSLKMPKVDLKGPQVDIKGPKVEVRGPKGKVSVPESEVSVPSVEVDIQAPGGRLQGDVATKDSKFKMPKFKMPSFGMSAAPKGVEASVEVPSLKVEADVSLPAVQGELQTTDLSIQLPPGDLEVKADQVGVKLPDAQLSKGELAAPTMGASLKGHLPKVEMPSLKMPKVDLKGPQVDIKGPKVDVKGPKGEVSTPELEVSVPSLEVDIQAPGALMEGEVAAKDSKFKMPKFTMPSFGMSSTGKSMEASVKVPATKVEADVSLPTVQGDIKTTDLSMQLPSGDLEVKAGQVGVKLPDAKLPEGELAAPGVGAGMKGHLPKVQTPSVKMPKVDLKGPHVHIKGPKVDVKGPKGEVRAPEVELPMPSLEVDIQAPGASLEGDVAAKDSKFKTPKFKMPSSGVSAGGKATDASVEVPVQKVEVDVALPVVQGDIKTTDLSIQLPSGDLEVKAGQVGVKLPDAQLPEGELEAPIMGASLKGHLPKVQMPSLKMPKVDLKGPQVDIKGPKVDVKGPKGQVSVSELEVSVPSVEVDIQAPGATLEGDLATKDSKFKMPNFKMPSFGVSSTGKDTEASVEVPAPKVEADVALPAIQGELKTTDLSIQLLTGDLEVKAGQVGIKLPDAQLPEGDLAALGAGAGLKGHLPKVQMPSLKMTKVDLKGPQVDIKGPKVDMKGPKGEVSTPEVEVSVPSVEVDIQAPGAKLEGDVTTKDSTFKMPKFKMPSFGVSATGKSTEASLEVPTPTVEADVALPAVQGELQTTDLSIQLLSSELEVTAGQVGIKVPGAHVAVGELAAPTVGPTLKGHLPKVQMPSLKMPKVDLKGPQVDIKGPKVEGKGPKGEVSTPEVEVSVPSVEVDIQAPDAKLEGDVTAKGSKFKMPRFKMPSFSVSATAKDTEASVEVPTPKVEADVALPTVQREVKTADVSIELPSDDLEVKAGQVGTKLPDAQVPEGELEAHAAEVGLKGHLPKVQMPSMKMPKVDLKGPSVDIKGPKVDMKCPKGKVSAPELEMDIQAPAAKLEGDVAIKDSKFKMPKFKMPSFGVSAAGKAVEASVEVPTPKFDADVALPAVQGELKTTDLSIQLPSSDLEVKVGQEVVKLPNAQLPEGQLVASAEGAGLKGHLPKVHTPSVKMPKVDLKGPQVDIKGPKVDVKGPKGEVIAPELEVSVPSMEVDIQAPGSRLEGEVAAKDSKFKMSRFKMPSFGVSSTGKTVEASVEVPAPKVEADLTLPAVQGDIKTTDLSIQLPSGDLEVKADQEGVKLPDAKLPKGQLAASVEGASLKGHLSKVQMPSLKMPKVDLKGPQVDIKGPKVDMKGPKGEVSAPELEVSVSSVEVDIQAPGAKLEGDMTTKDSKFKMPRFKMPSFGVSSMGKTVEASVEVPTLKVKADVALPEVQGELKATDLSIQLPTGDLEVKAGQEGVKLPDAQLPKGELAAPVDGASLKGHMPKVQMPSLKMPKVDLKGPQVDIKGPKVDVRGPKGKVSVPEPEVSVPSVEVDIQAPRAKLEGDMALADKDMAAKDSRFKMPRFKMPSFSVSSTGKSMEASVEVPEPKVEVDVALPAIQGELKATDLSIQLPTGDLEVKAGQVGVKLLDAQRPEGELAAPAEGAGLKGHLPKVQMPSLKMTKVDLKGPQVDIKGPKVDMKGPKGEVSAPELEVSVPSVEVDIQAPGAKLEGDMAAKDSTFKMPKFKMPSFGVSATGKSTEASVEVPTLTVETDVALPEVQGELQTTDLSIQLPSSKLEVTAGQVGIKVPDVHVAMGELAAPTVGPTLKGHLPKVQMPSLKMPKVDMKGPKGEVSLPELEVSVPSVEVDIQAPGTTLEGDVALAAKDMAAKDSRFKMPKFKMPSFGVSATGKAMEALVDVPAPKFEADMALPAIQGELKTTDLSTQLPSADLEVKAGQVGVKLPDAQLPEGELAAPPAGAGLKGHLPKVQMPSLKMPEVDLKGPQVDIKGPKVDGKGPKGEVGVPELEVCVPNVEVDIQAPGAPLEGEVAAKDSKFKMPKFKMPSFGMSSTGKTIETSVGVPAPKVKADVSVPVLKDELKTTDLSIQLPSGDLEVNAGHVGMKLPDAQLPEGELVAPTMGAGLKGHLPKVQMPSLKMPRVAPKGPQVEIEGPKVDVKGPKGEVSASELEVSVPSVEVDIQAPSAKLEGDVALADKVVAAKDSKFKMPRFKLQSFGVSAAGRAMEASVEVPMPKVEADVALPTVQGELKTTDLSIQLPSSDLEVMTGQAGVKLPDAQLPEGELVPPAEGADLKGHLPKVQMLSLKMPKVDIQGPKVDVKGPKGEESTPELEVSVPSVEVDIQAPGAKLEGDVALVAMEGSRLLRPGASGLPLSGFPMDSCLSDGPSSLVEVPDVPPPSSLDIHGDSVDLSLPSFYGRVFFPKFYKPRFGYSVQSTDFCPSESDTVLSPQQPAPSVESSETAMLSCQVVPPSLVTGDPPHGVELPCAPSAGGAPYVDAAREEKGGSFKLPGLKLPSFSRPLKKEAEATKQPVSSLEDPTLTLVSGSEKVESQLGTAVSEVEVSPDLSKKVKAGLSTPRPVLPTLMASGGQAGLPQGVLDASFSSTRARDDFEGTERASGDGGGGGTVAKKGPPEGEGQPCGEGPAITTKDPLQLSCTGAERVPIVGSPEEVAAVGDTPVDSHKHRFKMPKFRMPGFRRSSSKEQDADGGQDVAQIQLPAATVSAEVETAARGQASHIPGSKAGAPVSPWPSESGAGVTAAESAPCADDVLRPELPPAGPSGPDPPASEVRTRPAEGSLPLRIPGLWPSEPQALPGGTDGRPQKEAHDLAMEKRAETGASQPEGPLKLKASRTTVPSHISVVNVHQLWEDSVQTVTFPKIKVPRFSVSAPGSEADIFFPGVREVQRAEASVHGTLNEDSPGLWGARLLRAGPEHPREQPVGLELSSEAAGVSRVRVHIQGAQGERQEITARGGVIREGAELQESTAFSAEIVRESEIPVSAVQTPSYGFSLRKATLPDLPAQAGVHTAAQDSGVPEESGGSPTLAVPREASLPGRLQPDTDAGEPFEMISASVHLPGLHASAASAPASLPLADSGSDEEPAEILEFPDDSQEVSVPLAGEDGTPKERPDGKKSSGLLWSWLPSIGFSSAEETRANSQDGAQRAVPVQTQPGPRSDAELPKKQERAGWFRFPKLGFSSSPTKKSRGPEEDAGRTEQTLQEEAVTFFDAQESFSPEEEEGGEPAAAAVGSGPGSKGMVASSARTELILVERDKDTGEESMPGPVAK